MRTVTVKSPVLGDVEVSVLKWTDRFEFNDAAKEKKPWELMPILLSLCVVTPSKTEDEWNEYGGENMEDASFLFSECTKINDVNGRVAEKK